MARPAPGAVAGRQVAAQRAWHSLTSEDFAQAMAAPVLAKSAHFVVHYVAARPASADWRPRRTLDPEMSTAAAPISTSSVDNNSPATGHWFGLVVPKRHARRAVTRNVIKRQMRAQADGYCPRLPPGQWLIRLRAPFDPRQFGAAASAQLREAARGELDRVLASVAHK